MTIFELLIFNREIISRLRVAGVSLADTDHLDLFADFSAMTAEGLKVTYAVAVLADKYHLSQRKVYSIVRRFRRECTPFSIIPPKPL